MDSIVQKEPTELSVYQVILTKAETYNNFGGEAGSLGLICNRLFAEVCFLVLYSMNAKTYASVKALLLP